MAVKRGLPPAQLKEDLGPLKIEFWGLYVDQLMIKSILHGLQDEFGMAPVISIVRGKGSNG